MTFCETYLNVIQLRLLRLCLCTCRRLHSQFIYNTIASKQIGWWRKWTECCDTRLVCGTATERGEIRGAERRGEETKKKAENCFPLWSIYAPFSRIFCDSGGKWINCFIAIRMTIIMFTMVHARRRRIYLLPENCENSACFFIFFISIKFFQHKIWWISYQYFIVRWMQKCGDEFCLDLHRTRRVVEGLLRSRKEREKEEEVGQVAERKEKKGKRLW